MKILAIIGSESHSTSSGWSKLLVNGKKVSHRDAVSSEWITKYGDRHASWVECVFEVSDGDQVEWQAGANSGNRGMNKRRQNLVFVADSKAAEYQTEDLGYPASNATLRGRLRLITDKDAAKAKSHSDLVASL